MSRSLPGWPGASLAIASAVLFGASTPFAKLLLDGGVSPWLLAGLPYLGLGTNCSGPAADCLVIEVLADHGLCVRDHRAPARVVLV